MPFKAPMSVFLAFALVVSCYPFSVAYADDEGPSDGRSYYSPVSDSGAGGNPGADGQAVEAEAEEANSLDSPLAPSGGGLAFPGDILPAVGDDYSGSIQVDGMADVDGRTGKAANADAQEQHEADSGGGEAVAQDAAAAEAQEVEASPFSEEVAAADYGISLASISDSKWVTTFYGELSQSTGTQGFQVAGFTRYYQVGSIVWVVAALYQMLHASLLNISSDISSIHDLTSHIGVNTEQFLTYLKNLSNYSSEILGDTHWNGYLSGQGTADFSVAALLGRIYNRIYADSSAIAAYLHWSGYLPGYGEADFSLASLIERFYEVSRSSLSNINSNLVWSGNLPGYGAADFSVAALVERLFEMSNTRLSTIAGTSVWHGSLSGYGEADFSSASILGRLYNLVYTKDFSNGSSGGGDVLDKVLSGVDTIGSVLGGISGFLNPGSVVDGVTDVLGNIADIPEIADGFIGDLQFDSLDALSSNISDVVQSKFPFSIPFVFNGVLLMFQASAAPPVFEFDFWGSPMVLDFSDYEGLAEFTRFFSVFFWLIGLLSVSRRFIFFGGGSDGD